MILQIIQVNAARLRGLFQFREVDTGNRVPDISFSTKLPLKAYLHQVLFVFQNKEEAQAAVERPLSCCGCSLS